MKYLKYLLGILLLLIILFFVIGMITPDVSYESEVTVNKTADEAWATMSDESKMSQWISGFKRTEPVSGEPNTIGAVSRVYVVDNGEEMEMEETITNFKKNELLAMKFTMDFMDMDYEITFDKVDGGTKIKSKSTTVGNGIFAKSMIALIKGSMKKQEDINMNNLKRLIEENKTNYFPESELESENNEVGIDERKSN